MQHWALHNAALTIVHFIDNWILHWSLPYAAVYNAALITTHCTDHCTLHWSLNTTLSTALCRNIHCTLLHWRLYNAHFTMLHNEHSALTTTHCCSVHCTYHRPLQNALSTAHCTEHITLQQWALHSTGLSSAHCTGNSKMLHSAFFLHPGLVYWDLTFSYKHWPWYSLGSPLA